MQEHFDDRQWIQYLDGALDPATSSRMWGHIESCPECGDLYFTVTTAGAALSEEARRLREAALLSKEAVDALLARCPGGPKRRTPREAMLLLRLLVEPICGSGLAGLTISLAAQRSAASRDEPVTERNWSLFISNLSEAMESVCGSAAGRLVSLAGVSLGINGS